jgi:hypothetical protein
MGLRERLKSRLKKTLGLAEPPKPTPAPAAVAPPIAKPRPAPTPPPRPGAPVLVPELSAEERAKQEKVARHFEKARKGVLRFVDKAGGRASLADMHGHSEARYFIGHQKFSQLLEGLIAEGLVIFHATEGEGELTDAGRDYIT